MKLFLTPDEVNKLLYNAFVDGGLRQLQNCGVTFDYRDKDYEAAVKKLTSPCLEDIWLQILKDGNPLLFREEEEVGRPLHELTLEKATKNLINIDAILDIVESLDEKGNADSLTHFNLLQFMLFKELKYS